MYKKTVICSVLKTKSEIKPGTGNGSRNELWNIFGYVIKTKTCGHA